MIPAPRLDHLGTAAPLTKRFTRWGSWLFFLLVTADVIVCHGCHGDEDNELCAPPPIRAGSVSDELSQAEPAALARDRLSLAEAADSERFCQRGTSIGNGRAKSLTISLPARSLNENFESSCWMRNSSGSLAALNSPTVTTLLLRVCRT